MTIEISTSAIKKIHESLKENSSYILDRISSDNSNPYIELNEVKIESDNDMTVWESGYQQGLEDALKMLGYNFDRIKDTINLK